MLKHILIKGLQYEGETDEAMRRREAAMEENNRQVDALYADWARQRITPMPSMREWAAARGIGSVSESRQSPSPSPSTDHLAAASAQNSA
jgi:hypothetical protein